ncbi:ribosome small subunit-dependent GTPase A [Mesoplasma corruscae]|uniref:Small ribosomal subunit biogenesis GTPase RsgA n=1 Tax=Mesoplasma corruscae TaxID=216874 RepID=A0A2S5RGN6_9MOLU|nr:ribosome small subunit-dependent GTPase A [Mesoplasma corruscae]PPE06451.1 ribosome biogenesis GTPase [Mesoplasma corruscae]
MKAKIIQINSNSSSVLTEFNQIYTASIKGNIKKKLSPIVGDNVILEFLKNNEVHIIDIKERINLLYRPKIANVDQAIIVTSLYEPLFSSFILNKYIMLSQAKKIKPILLFTKFDLLKVKKEYKEVMNKIKNYIDLDFHVIILDNKNEQNYKLELGQLKSLLVNKVSFFTGQTGAGKSTTLNHFLPNEVIRTNEISIKLNRGKHTTTSVKIYNLDDNLLIADTPGFSSFELQDIKIEDILKTFSPFLLYKSDCKFLDCTHIHEKKCGVKSALNKGNMPLFMYDDYKKVYEELLSRKVKY